MTYNIDDNGIDDNRPARVDPNDEYFCGRGHFLIWTYPYDGSDIEWDWQWCLSHSLDIAGGLTHATQRAEFEAWHAAEKSFKKEIDTAYDEGYEAGRKDGAKYGDYHSC